MAALHAALKAFSPIPFSDLPTDKDQLDSWLSDIFNQSQLVLESIPIADSGSHIGFVSHSTTSIASNASEMTISSARSAPPIPEHQALQKEWGKPVKLGSKENSLGMSVYKLSAKDGRGAWFARHSVHEGLPFSQFKKALEQEFPESLAVQGAPGEGNIRGIGGETKVEDIKTSDKGKVEVYRLSAQFPGPTTPRDFVTMLITSDSAMKATHEDEPVPRHYMIVSKPCDHPRTQPQSGFIRGYYESVEFIREVPKKAKASQSATELSANPRVPVSLGKAAAIRNAQQETTTASSEGEKLEATAMARKRSVTEPGSVPQSTNSDKAEVEDGAVEWIMITRSDPGGSVPRFMVERGTPSSICADAEKFLNWACQGDFNEDGEAGDLPGDLTKRRSSRRKDSHASFRNSRMAGLQDENELSHDPNSRVERPIETHRDQNVLVGAVSGAVGAVGAVGGAAVHYLSAYTPQVVLDHLPGHHRSDSRKDHLEDVSSEDEDDGASTVTRGTFESADSHLTNEGSETGSHDTKIDPGSSPILSHHEKQLQKIQQRRAALENKFSESKSKLELENSEQAAKDEQSIAKANEKHEKELKKQREKYEKELKKLDEKQEKERKKMEAKKRKQEDKDEKSKLTRERDEARQELELLKKESDILRNMVADLQKENTKLVAQLGRASLADLSGDEGSSRRSGSLRGSTEKVRTELDSPSSSIRGQ